MVGLTILGRCGLWKAMEQGYCGGDVLACPSKVGKGFIIGDDPLVYVAGHGAPPTAAQRLVDRHVPNMSSRGRALTGVELASPRQRALRLLHRRTLEQRADLMMGPTILGCNGLREPSEQG